MYLFSQENYEGAIAGFESILLEDANAFDARLSLGMAFCRIGDFARAIEEGHRAAEIKPNEQLVHTNLSLFYMRSGDKETAEHHGLQARIASWKQDMTAPAENPESESSELSLAKAPPKPYKTPEKFPDMPWKNK